MRNEGDVVEQSVGHVLDAFVAQGLVPETVIDVGVATGTPDIYSRFPNAFYFLVEPLSYWKANIEYHLKHLNGVHLHCAASDECGNATISVPIGGKPGGANLLYNYSNEEVQFSEYIELARLDDLIDRKKIGKHR